MQQIRKTRWLAAAFLALVSSTGCTTYYRVTDPTSHKDYYTTETRRVGSAVTFKDGRTGADVTLQNSEIETISKEQYDAGRFTRPVDE